MINIKFDKLLEESSGEIELAIERLIEISMIADGNIQGYFFKMTDLLFMCFKPLLTEAKAKYHVAQKAVLLANKIHVQNLKIDDLGYSFGHKLKEANGETSIRLRATKRLQPDSHFAMNMSFTCPSEDASFLFIESYQLDPSQDMISKVASEFEVRMDESSTPTSELDSWVLSNTYSTQDGQGRPPSTKGRMGEVEKLESFVVVPSLLSAGNLKHPIASEIPRNSFVPNQRPALEQKGQTSFENMLAGMEDDPLSEEVAHKDAKLSEKPASKQETWTDKETGQIKENKFPEIKIGKRRSLVVEDRTTTFAEGTSKNTDTLELGDLPESLTEMSSKIDAKLVDSVLIQPPVKPDTTLTVTVSQPASRSSGPPAGPSDLVTQGSHLVVFVHGYEGCSFDMKTLKNMFCYVAKPHVVCHCAVANETDSTIDIEVQGQLLAEEILELVKFNFTTESHTQPTYLEK